MKRLHFIKTLKWLFIGVILAALLFYLRPIFKRVMTPPAKGGAIALGDCVGMQSDFIVKIEHRAEIVLYCAVSKGAALPDSLSGRIEINVNNQRLYDLPPFKSPATLALIDHSIVPAQRSDTYLVLSTSTNDPGVILEAGVTYNFRVIFSEPPEKMALWLVWRELAKNRDESPKTGLR